ncbi:hypothetical protein [Chitinophaga japonensis]|uniref:Uncharacterized protein n=1 Tax=Chitinophaga japonensis TaxID=104662 RepID=A0A562T0I5_CHIJA|nr:hypothetical protein [Chitinophaga japonensis]TWI86520.1 hypothetical protein LX66_3778 [Chitinophaga japonensis]
MSRLSITGLAAAVIIIISVFLPWLTIESRHLVFTGLHTAGSNFGEPGRLNIALAVVAAILFLPQRLWAQRVNIFVTAFLVAWTFRNMIIFARCEMGECPEKEIGLYLSLAAAITTFVCTVFWKKKIS